MCGYQIGQGRFVPSKIGYLTAHVPFENSHEAFLPSQSISQDWCYLECMLAYANEIFTVGRVKS